MMSSSTRSGGLFSMLRRAAAPSSATLSLYSSRSASTRMSMFVFTSSTMRMRLSDRSFTSAAPGRGFEGVLQSAPGLGKGVALDERFELRPARRVEQRTERIVMRLDELAGRRIESDSSAASCAAASRDRAGSAGAAGGTGAARRTPAVPSAARIAVDQRIERSGDTLSRSLDLVGVRPVANHAFQCGRGRLHAASAPMLPATPLSVWARRSASARSPVARASAICRPPGPVARRTGAAASGRAFVSADASQAVVRVEAGNRRQAPSCGAGAGRLIGSQARPPPACRSGRRSRTAPPDRSAWRCDRSCRRRGSAGAPPSWRARSSR